MLLQPRNLDGGCAAIESAVLHLGMGYSAKQALSTTTSTGDIPIHMTGLFSSHRLLVESLHS